MGITDAKKYIGKKCAVRFLDRSGNEHNVTSMIHDVTFVPLYGGYLITDTEDLMLDKVVGVQLCDDLTSVPLAA